MCLCAKHDVLLSGEALCEFHVAWRVGERLEITKENLALRTAQRECGLIRKVCDACEQQVPTIWLPEGLVSTSKGNA